MFYVYSHFHTHLKMVFCREAGLWQQEMGTLKLSHLQWRIAMLILSSTSKGFGTCSHNKIQSGALPICEILKYCIKPMPQQESLACTEVTWITDSSDWTTLYVWNHSQMFKILYSYITNSVNIYKYICVLPNFVIICNVSLHWGILQMTLHISHGKWPNTTIVLIYDHELCTFF